MRVLVEQTMMAINRARRRRLVALAGALLLLGGCTVGPNYRRPTAPVPQTFKEAPPPGWKQAQPSEAVLRGKWWEIYNDPALNALEEQVSISNQNVLVAMAQYQQARDAVRVARSNLYPTVTTGPSITQTRTSPNLAPNSTTFISGTRTEYSLPFDVSYQADIWGNIRRSVRGSSATAQGSAADLENVRLTFHAELAQFYFELHGLDGDEELLERTVLLYQQYLKLTKDRFELGVASGADVAQAETQLYTAQAQLVDFGVQRAQFEHAIAILIGQPPAALTIPRIASAPNSGGHSFDVARTPARYRRRRAGGGGGKRTDRDRYRGLLPCVNAQRDRRISKFVG